MIKLSTELKERMSRRLKEIEAHDTRIAKGLFTIKARLIENVESEANVGSWVWRTDGPKSIGGKELHPSPLHYFISGLPFCQLSHYAEYSAAEGLLLDSVEMSVKAKYDRFEVRFEEISYETKIESPEPDEKIRELVKKSEEACYVTGTLKRAIPLRGSIFLNGKNFMNTFHGA